MANETDIAQGAGALGLSIGGAIVQFNKVAVMPSLVNMVPCVKGSNKARIPVYTKLVIADVATASTGAEGAIARKEIISTAKDAEALRNHVDTLITDLTVHGNADAFLVNAGQAIGNAIALEFDAQCLTGFVDGFATTAGANTTGMSMAVLFEGVAKLEENSAPRPYSAVLHPLNMWGDFGMTNEMGSAIVNESGAALTGGNTVGSAISSAGWVSNLGGVNMYTSPSVSIADGAGTSQGGIFAKTAIGCGYIDFGAGNFIQIEHSRNAPYASTEITANGYFGFVETVDLHGVTLLCETV